HPPAHNHNFPHTPTRDSTTTEEDRKQQRTQVHSSSVTAQQRLFVMLSSNTHLALLALLLSSQQGESHRYRNHHHGRHLFRPLPTFMSNEVDTGAFRPFPSHPRGGSLFTSTGPLVDIFQEVVGDIKKAVARELSDSSPLPRTPPHEVVETAEAATVTVDLPGCKKEDVDAQLSEDAGKKTLTITAVRKKRALANGNSNSGENTGTLSAGASETPDGTTATSSGNAEEAVAEPGGAARPATESASPSFTEEKFEVSFLVGDQVDVSAIRGSLEDGVLTLVLPKLAPEPPAEPIDIPIDFNAGKSEGRVGGRGQDAALPGRKEASGEGTSGAEAGTHISLS
ncbi:unnamed protein product, partial [Scytosiphon promiscuus]